LQIYGDNDQLGQIADTIIRRFPGWWIGEAAPRGVSPPMAQACGTPQRHRIDLAPKTPPFQSLFGSWMSYFYSFIQDWGSHHHAGLLSQSDAEINLESREKNPAM